MLRLPIRDSGRQSLAAVAGVRECAPPAVAGARGAPQRSTNPATTGCPVAAPATGVHSRANPEANGAAIRVGDASLSLSNGRVGTSRVGTGCGVPTRLRRVARRRAGPARALASITIKTTIKTTMTAIWAMLRTTKLATKLDNCFQLLKNNPVTFLTRTRALNLKNLACIRGGSIRILPLQTTSTSFQRGCRRSNDGKPHAHV